MNNEPAFPSGSMGPDGLHISESIYEGLTIRDYFAAKAMQSNLNSFMSYGDNAEEPLSGGAAIEIAMDSYLMADAMMKARGES